MTSSMNPLNQRLAIVTGGNRGIGREIARQLASRDLRVLITCRDEDKGLQTVTELLKEGLSVELQVVDVNDVQSIRQLIEKNQ